MHCELAMLDTALPVATYGNGNCLFRTVSLSLFGYDDAHLALRVMAAITRGGAENAGVENAGVENAGVDSRGGKCRSGKYRNDNVWKAVKQKIKIINILN